MDQNSRRYPGGSRNTGTVPGLLLGTIRTQAIEARWRPRAAFTTPAESAMVEVVQRHVQPIARSMGWASERRKRAPCVCLQHLTSRNTGTRAATCDPSAGLWPNRTALQSIGPSARLVGKGFASVTHRTRRPEMQPERRGGWARLLRLTTATITPGCGCRHPASICARTILLRRDHGPIAAENRSFERLRGHFVFNARSRASAQYLPGRSRRRAGVSVMVEPDRGCYRSPPCQSHSKGRWSRPGYSVSRRSAWRALHRGAVCARRNRCAGSIERP